MPFNFCSDHSQHLTCTAAICKAFWDAVCMRNISAKKGLNWVAPCDPLWLCAGLRLTAGMQGQDQALKLYFVTA